MTTAWDNMTAGERETIVERVTTRLETFHEMVPFNLEMVARLVIEVTDETVANLDYGQGHADGYDLGYRDGEERGRSETVEGAA